MKAATLDPQRSARRQAVISRARVMALRAERRRWLIRQVRRAC